jgi:hypothetical protein
MRHLKESLAGRLYSSLWVPGDVAGAFFDN